MKCGRCGGALALRDFRGMSLENGTEVYQCERGHFASVRFVDCEIVDTENVA